MYTPGKPQTPQPTTIVFYNSSKEEPLLRDNMIVTDGGGGDEPTIHNSPTPLSSGVPKKRAEIWVQEETRALISLRKELDLMFNTSKSNKHLWESISSKMRERGFDRSPTMCTDKWRNLLKEYKKAKQNILDGSCSVKMSFYKEIDGILKERTKNEQDTSTAAASKVEPFMPFADKGIDDASLTFGPVEANARSTLNLERSLDEDHHHHPLAITAGGASPWNWRETPPEGENSDACDGRVITVKYGDYTKRIGIDGTANAIKEAVKSAFRLRTKRAFWLEDEDSVVRSLDRDMPIGNYTLHVDEGLTIKVCCYEDTEHLPVHTEDKTFYTEEDFRDFLSRRCWTYLREYNGFRHVDSMDELCPGAVYRGVN